MTNAAPRNCTECGTPADSLDPATPHWVVRALPVLTVVLLGVTYFVATFRPAPLTGTWTRYVSTLNFNGPGVGAPSFLGDGITVERLRGGLVDRPLLPELLDDARAWGQVIPDRRLQVSHGGPQGQVFHSGFRGIAGVRGRTFEMRAFDNALARSGPHQPDDPADWSDPGGIDVHSWLVRSKGQNHAYTTGALAAQRSETASPRQSCLVALAAAMLSFILARLIGAAVARRAPRRVTIAACLAATAVAAALLIVDARTDVRHTRVQPPQTDPGFADTPLTAADLAAMATSPDGEARAREALAAALPLDADPGALVRVRWRERGATRTTAWTVGGDTWLAVATRTTSLDRGGQPMPMPRVPMTWLLMDGSLSVFLPVSEGDTIADTVTVYLVPAAVVALAAGGAWYTGAAVRAVVVSCLTRTRRRRGFCVRCAYPLPARTPEA